MNAKIAEETLAARHGLTPTYDPLTQSARQFSEEMHELERELTTAHPDMVPVLAELREQMTQRGQAIEHFKTQNSVLKNSLYYLPLAAEQVIDALETPAMAAPENEHEREQLGKVLSELVQVTLTQNLLGGKAETARVEQQLELAQGLSAKVPAAAQERYRLLLAHAKTASRTQQLVDPIVRDELLAAPVGATLVELDRRYGQYFEAALREAAVVPDHLVWLVHGAARGGALGCLEAPLGLRRARKPRLGAHQEAQRGAERALGRDGAREKESRRALVPHHISLRDCEVAAVMRPTAQVGGDYYDVFEVDGTEWVLIGDVSGHGVPAGLVMMMCQTAVHSVVTSRPNISPDELLAIVNSTLTQNIERLGEDKYMTISALRRDPDGSFKFAGMHQDLLVYRARSARIEHLRAEGTWLGIAKNIRGLNPVRTLKLEPGDSLVLYTDGITEASRDGQMLDIDGLGKAVLAHGNDSAEQILSGILQTLDGYEVKDDVAAIIIKQLEPQRMAKVPAA